MTKWLEIIQDEKGQLSSTRVSMMFGTIVGALVVFMLVILLFIITSRGINTQTEYTAVANTAALTQILSALSTIMALFFALCAGVYGMAKFSDNSVSKTRIQAEAPVAEPARVVVPDAETVNVKADGNVSVIKKEPEE